MLLVPVPAGAITLGFGTPTVILATGEPPITPTITEYSQGITGGTISSITRGPDGNMWFVEYSPSAIAKISMDGKITEVLHAGDPGLPALSPSPQPNGITTGPDGNVWFTIGRNPGGVGMVNPATGVGTQMATGGSGGMSPDAGPGQITAGPDGNLWFPEVGSPGAIARITPSGAVTEFTTGLTPNSSPNSITLGPDGNLWFTEVHSPQHIGRMNPLTQAIGEFSVGLTPAGDIRDLVAGPDGNVWFAQFANPGAIGDIAPDGTITEVATGGVNPGFTPDVNPNGIALGPDGHLWFTETHQPSGPGSIGRFEPGTGHVQEFPTPTANSGPASIALGPDGNLWFTEFTGKIGRITTPPTAVTSGATATGISATVSGVANGHAQPTSVHVEYKPVVGNTSVSADQAIGTTTGDTPVSATLTGLQPLTTYQARIVAANPTGSAAGAFTTFTTGSIAPTVSAAKQSAKRWREGAALAKISRKRRRPPLGTTFSFTLDQPARTTFAFTQPGAGRRSHGRCVARTKRNRHARKCTRTAATMSFAAHAGVNRVRFEGRLSRRHKLKLGSYTLVITATNGAHQSSAPVRLRFKIVKG